MNWEALSSIAEIVGATAVVVSLIYLAAQIRQNSKQVEEQVRALRLQGFDRSSSDFSALRLSISSSPQIADVWRRAKENYSDLPAAERAQVNELLHELLWAYQSMLSRRHEGAVDEALWQLVENNIAYWMGHDGFRQWWRTEKKTPYTDELEELVDRVCSELESQKR